MSPPESASISQEAILPSSPPASAGRSDTPPPPPPASQPASPPPVAAHGMAATSAPLASPSLSSNRFGLSLGGFIQRRPRGNTIGQTGGGRSPGNDSPSAELPPSPSGGERTGGYGFPALRRTLSRRGGSSAGEPPRTRAGRSSSQPPAPVGSHDAGSISAGGSSRPQTPLDASQPPFSALTLTSSLPALDADPGPSHRIRLVPHLESSRSLHFDPVDRDLAAFVVLRIGRFTDRSNSGQVDPHRIAFKSKVVSRGHAEIWCDASGKFFIKDTKSSSGTFLNHIRLSAPGAESTPFPLKDGDVLQLGVDYQGGTEEIYRCVKMRIELNRGWQRGMNTFNTAAMAQLRALGGATPLEEGAPSSSAIGASMSVASTQRGQAPTTSITDCCICLYPVTVCQALFIAPCSHVTHFKCIRPLVDQNYPGFCCPLCRTYADLEADVEIEPWEPEEAVPAPHPSTVREEPDEEDEGNAMGVDEPAAPSVLPPTSASDRASLAVAGADDVSVPIQIAEHRRPVSRPASVREKIASSTAAMPMEIAGSSDTSFPASVYDSLADAATPPNSTFLSTLADHGALARFQSPASIGGVLDSLASTSTPSVPGCSPAPGSRASFGSEEETDSPREEESYPGAITPTTVEKGKAVAKRGADVERTMEIELGDAMDVEDGVST